MTLITVFSAPKSFTDPHIATIQRNAIQSWLRLGEEVEVILVGCEPGLAEIAEELGVRIFPEVARNEQGTPLVSSIFSLARQNSQSPLLTFVNGDILLLPDLPGVTRSVASQLENFLIVGQRWDLTIQEPLDFSQGWERRLQAMIETHGRPHLLAGSDFFIFPRHVFWEIPDFAIGRAGWDNWMIYHARMQGWPVVDATPSLTVIHQDHDYSHLPNGKPHYDLEESNLNMALAGGSAHMYYILDSDRELRHGKIRPPRLTSLRLLRKIELWLTPKDGRRSGPRWALARKFRRWRRYKTGSLV
jgi:hypothetical protein